MKKNILFISILAIGVLSLNACKKDNDDNGSSGPAKPGTVTIDITNVAGSVNVDETGATSYTNSSGESFTVTKLKYYISNVRLMKDDNIVYTMPESYFLVDESNQASTKLALPDVPGGDYTAIRFTIGVDSARNVSGAQTGALDPANGMFWTWSSGYIFYKLEGTSPAAPGGITYHIGGFRESNNTNAIREVEVSFAGATLNVDGAKEAEIHLLADVLKVFSQPNTISISAVNFQMAPGGNALLIADNYAQMFSFDHLHND